MFSDQENCIGENNKVGSREESKVTSFLVFSHITNVGLFKVRLDYVRVNECPQGFRNRRKATVKI